MFKEISKSVVSRLCTLITLAVTEERHVHRPTDSSTSSVLQRPANRLSSFAVCSLPLALLPSAQYTQHTYHTSNCTKSITLIINLRIESSETRSRVHRRAGGAGCCHTEELSRLLVLPELNTLRTGLLNRLNARSRGLTFRHRASRI